MPSKKVKIEISDSNGGNFSISYSGEINREKVLQLLDFVDLLGGATNGGVQRQTLTKFGRVTQLIHTHYPVGPFSSSKIQEDYEREFNEPICLSTVSTYLSRLVERSIIMNSGSSKRCYKMRRAAIIQERVTT